MDNMDTKKIKTLFVKLKKHVCSTYEIGFFWVVWKISFYTIHWNFSRIFLMVQGLSNIPMPGVILSFCIHANTFISYTTPVPFYSIFCRQMTYLRQVPFKRSFNGKARFILVLCVFLLISTFYSFTPTRSLLFFLLL